jgi:hypothetical protein
VLTPLSGTTTLALLRSPAPVVPAPPQAVPEPVLSPPQDGVQLSLPLAPPRPEVGPSTTPSPIISPVAREAPPTTLVQLQESPPGQLEPTSGEGQTLESLLKNLHQTGFPPGIDTGAMEGQFPGCEAVRAVLGKSLTRQAVAGLYENAVPGAHANVVYVPTRDGGMSVNVSLRNGDGDSIAMLSRTFQRGEKGELNLHRGSVWVEPEYRGHAITDRTGLLEIALLRGLSDHPESKITLQAGGASGGQHDRQELGKYAWARAGLFGFGHKETRDGVQSPAQQLEGMRQAYAGWVASQELSEGVKQSLIGLSHSWDHPHDVATTSWPGLTIPVKSADEKSSRPCEVGKAFLLSEAAPRWNGECHVNAPLPPEGVAGLDRMRQRVARSDQQLATRDRAWATQLQIDPEQTLRKIARDGGKEWVEKLQGVPGAADTVAALKGEAMVAKLLGLATDPSVHAKVRLEALWDLRGREIALDPTVAKSLLEDPHDGVAMGAFQNQATLSSAAPDVQKELIDTALERFPVEPDKLFQGRTVRLDAARVLLKLQDAEGLQRLTRQESDPVARQGFADCLATLGGGPAQGVAAYPLASYPDGLW